VISFYTLEGSYHHWAKSLERDCQRLGLRYTIERLKSTGSWSLNCCMKPSFILEQLVKGSEPVLWVDVDGSVLRKPELSDYSCDFAARPITNPNRKRMWHVGTMLWTPSAASVMFLEAWIQRVGESTDESALEQTWRQCGDWLVTRALPPEYFVMEWDRSKFPDAVIVHRSSGHDGKLREWRAAMDYERDVI
jgi:hypothetical protein